jgi:hypothetical protein
LARETLVVAGEESSSDLTSTLSPASQAYAGAAANAASGAGGAAAQGAVAASGGEGGVSAAVAIEDSIDMARKRIQKGADGAKDKLPESSSPMLSRHRGAVGATLGTSTEIRKSHLHAGPISSTSSENLPRSKHDDSEDSELAMAINIDVPQLMRRLTFDVLVDETCAEVVRKVQAHLPALVVPPGHRFTLQLANGTMCGIGKTMLDLRIQPRDLVSLVPVKIADANREAPVARGELLRKVNELDLVVQKKQSEQSAAAVAAAAAAAAAATAAPPPAPAPAPAAAVASAAVPSKGDISAALKLSPERVVTKTNSKIRSSPEVAKVETPPSSRRTGSITAAAPAPLPGSGESPKLAPKKSRRPSLADELIAAAAEASAAAETPTGSSPTNSSILDVKPPRKGSGSRSTLAVEDAAAAAAAASVKRDETKRHSGGFFNRIKDQLTGKASKSRITRLLTVPHLSLMETVQISLKQTVAEALEEFGATFGMVKQTHTAAERAALLEPWTLYLTDISDSGSEMAIELEKMTLFSVYASLLEHCNLSIRKRTAGAKSTVRSSSAEHTASAAALAIGAPLPVRGSSDTLSSTSSAAAPLSPHPNSDSTSGAGSSGAVASAGVPATAAAATSAGGKKKKRSLKGSKHRLRSSSQFEELLAPAKATATPDEVLLSPSSSSSNRDETSPRFALSGAIANIKDSMAKIATSPDTTAALIQQNESLRIMLAQTLDRLERATEQLAMRALNESSSGASGSPRGSPGLNRSPSRLNASPTRAAALLSPRSASNLLRNSMLLRSLSPDRGTRLPRIPEGDEESARLPAPAAQTDDESARRTKALPPALTRQVSFPPPLVSPSSLALSMTAPEPVERKRAGSDLIAGDKKALEALHSVRGGGGGSGGGRAAYNLASDSDSDSDSSVPQTQSERLQWKGARLARSAKSTSTTMALEPPEWLFGDADGLAQSDRAQRRTKSQRSQWRSRRQTRKAAQQHGLRAQSDAPSRLAQELTDKLKTVEQRRTALREVATAGAPPSLRLSDSAATSKESAREAAKSRVRAEPLATAQMEAADMRERLFELGHTAVYRCVVRGATFTCKVFNSKEATRGEREAAWREVSILASLAHRNVVQFAGQLSADFELRLFVEFFLTTLADVLVIRRDSSESLSVADVTLFSLEIARALRYLHALTPPVAMFCLEPADIFYQANDYTGDVVLKIGTFTEARRVSITEEHLSDTSASSTASSATSPARSGSGSTAAAAVAAAAPSSGSFDASESLPSGWYGELSRRRGARAALVAPELHTIDRIAITLRSDIWSFAMIMFELLFLCAPYEREQGDLYEIARLVERGTPPQMADPERAAQPAFQPLLRILMRCFSLSPAARPTAQRLTSSLSELRRVLTCK